MAEQEQTFNLNQFSYEGAGKVYETLAKNATQEANTAGQNTSMFLGQHNQAASQASSYRNAANNSLGQANAALTRGNAAITRGNQTAANLKSEDTIKLVNSLSSLGEHYLAAEVTAKTLEGTVDGMKRTAEMLNTLDTDPDAVSSEIEGVLRAFEDNPNDPYLKNYAKQLTSVYAPARKVMESNRVETVGIGFAAHLAETDGVMSFKDKKDYAKGHDVDTAYLNNIHYSLVTSKYMKLLDEAPNSNQAISEILKLKNEDMNEQFDNVHFTESKSAKTKAKVTQADTAFKQAVAVKQKAVVATNKGVLASLMEDPFRQPPSVAMEAINNITDDPLVRLSKAKAFIKVRTEAVNQQEFTTRVDVAQPRPTDMYVNKDGVDTKFINTQTAAVAIPAYQQGDSTEFLGTLRNNTKEELATVKDYLTRTWESAATQQDLTKAVTQFNTIRNKPSGASLLRKVIPDEQFGDMLTLQYATDMKYGGDITKAKAWIDTAKGNPQALPNKKLGIQMAKRKDQLGDNYAVYAGMVNTMVRIDSSSTLALEKEAEIASYINDMRTEPDGAGRMVNTMNGPDKITESPGGEGTWNVLSNVLTNVMPDEEGHINMTKEGHVTVYDDMGALITHINPDVLIAVENKKAFDVAQADVAENGLPVMEVVNTSTVQIAQGLGNSFGTMLGKLGTHIYDNDPEFFDFIKQSWDTAIDTGDYILGSDTIRESLVPEEQPAGPLDAYNVVSGSRDTVIEPITEEDRIIQGLEIIKNLMTTPVINAQAGVNPLNDLENLRLNEVTYKNQVTKEKVEKVQEVLKAKQAETLLPPKSLADLAGIPAKEFDNLVRIESGGKGYTAKNPRSSAFGKYQFMTYNTKSTGYGYAKDIGYKGEPGKALRTWMTPERQDKMFIEFTKDNIKGLKRNNLPTDAFHIYGVHQQGLSGLKQILSGNITKAREKNMLQNVPQESKHLRGQKLADAWEKHWRAETSL